MQCSPWKLLEAETHYRFNNRKPTTESQTNMWSIRGSNKITSYTMFIYDATSCYLFSIKKKHTIAFWQSNLFGLCTRTAHRDHTCMPNAGASLPKQYLLWIMTRKANAVLANQMKKGEKLKVYYLKVVTWKLKVERGQSLFSQNVLWGTPGKEAN